MKKIKVAYIGGGSKAWARVFMNDLALQKKIKGEIALYDTDLEAAYMNQKFGERINEAPNTKTKWKYKVYEKIEPALKNADFVVISILPGTFKEMQSDVHACEKYGSYQTVGDTVGVGGVLRAMRTVPIYEFFAKKIKQCCPEAWVLNFTNPMTILVKTLYDVFPEIKAIGCCHEVFNAQDFLLKVVKEELGEDADRQEISTDVIGVNHFTWITKASYKNHDLFKLLPSFIDKFYDEGYNQKADGVAGDKKYLIEPGLYNNKVKMDLFNRYGILGGAGDRHLVEFVNAAWYMKNPEYARNEWKFNLTPVSFRINRQQKQIKYREDVVNGLIPVEVTQSREEAIEIMQALLGLGDFKSNVNVPNVGQMQGYPLGAVVETNAFFEQDRITPMVASPAPIGVQSLINTHILNQENLYQGIKNRDLKQIFEVFVCQPLNDNLDLETSRKLFKEMIDNTQKYLVEYFDLNQEF